VSDGDGAAVDVDYILVDTEFSYDGDGLSGKTPRCIQTGSISSSVNPVRSRIAFRRIVRPHAHISGIEPDRHAARMQREAQCRARRPFPGS